MTAHALWEVKFSLKLDGWPRRDFLAGCMADANQSCENLWVAHADRRRAAFTTQTIRQR